MSPNGIKICPASEGGEVFLEVRLPEGRLIDMPVLALDEAKELLSELQMAVEAAEAGKDHQASWIRNKEFATRA